MIGRIINNEVYWAVKNRRLDIQCLNLGNQHKRELYHSALGLALCLPTKLDIQQPV